MPDYPPGTPSWVDLSSPDPDASASGGVIEMGENFPPEVPPNWAPYFCVDEADEIVAKAESGGGRLMEGPRDIPDVGRFAFFADPHNAVFAVIARTPDGRERDEKLAAQIGA